ncbi:MAG: acetyl-CoA synthase subunit gamma [Acidobacteriia bacterium]|nr:acetyl-CoA synthase subunit gamma [Terriglobia bacterium]
MENENKQCGTSCCGGGQTRVAPTVRPGLKKTDDGVPVVDARLTLSDRWGGWKVRLGIGRGRYRVEPGLYAFGAPDSGSPVLVTANYKLTFDSLRKELTGLKAWILVLDTHGINVWCAAGKGTFGTAELVRRIESSGLRARITHHTLILPQLGAPGVAGHEVKKLTGFHTVYGPVRARDVKRFLADGTKATPEMRLVRFGLKDRLALVPTELGGIVKYIFLFLMVSAAWHLVHGTLALRTLAPLSLMLIGAALSGTLFVPALLPWIPFRSFALKGWLLGMLWAVAAGMIYDVGPANFAGILLLLPAISAFLALNFTGSTTFTSQTGVNKEIRLFARPIALSAILGIALMVF